MLEIIYSLLLKKGKRLYGLEVWLEDSLKDISPFLLVDVH